MSQQIKNQVEFFSEVLEIPLSKFEHKIDISQKTKTWNSKTKIELGDYKISLLQSVSKK